MVSLIQQSGWLRPHREVLKSSNRETHCLHQQQARISGSCFTCNVNSSPSSRFGNLGVVDALRNKSLLKCKSGNLAKSTMIGATSAGEGWLNWRQHVDPRRAGDISRPGPAHKLRPRRDPPAHAGALNSKGPSWKCACSPAPAYWCATYAYV